ncbi:DUF6188 family protein [Streptomyces orinoci]|uniref:DUF6188 family protein n=1 Tax=Streptomyces orinoci TaxID=67339 RepID=A0ABV3K6K3_STRON|nr:DUF6188 family protein [Streptomyces orinoci]
MNTATQPIEHEDRWVLNLRAAYVRRISVDFQLTLALDADWEVVLGGPARLSSGSVRTDPGVLLSPETQDVAPALPLFGAEVLSAVAFKAGTLRIAFGNGRHLTCPADTSFEAWGITGPGGWRFAALPGGGLAVWVGARAGHR